MAGTCVLSKNKYTELLALLLGRLRNQLIKYLGTNEGVRL